MHCIFKLILRHFAIGIARTSFGYFCFIRGVLDGEPIGAYSAASSLLQAVLKTWEEYQSMHFFRPKGAHLRTFTKAHKMFSCSELKALLFQFSPSFVYGPDISNLAVASAERSGRVIAYYFHKKEV